MPSQSCLTTRTHSAVPQFRRAVPADLWDVFSFRELGGSLQTREQAEARRRRNALVAATDSLFADARTLRATGAANRATLLDMFRDQRALVCAGHLARYTAPRPHTDATEVPQPPEAPGTPETPEAGAHSACWPAIYDEVFAGHITRPPIRAHFSLKPAMIPRILARRRAVMLH